MKKKNGKIVGLLHRLLEDATLTKAENKKLKDWRSLSSYNDSLYQEITNKRSLKRELKRVLGINEKSLWDKVRKKL